jgi:hypothetical protein
MLNLPHPAMLGSRGTVNGNDTLRKIDLYPAVWAQMRNGLDADFVQLMEREIVP